MTELKCEDAVPVGRFEPSFVVERLLTRLNPRMEETFCEECDRQFPHSKALIQHYNYSNQHICLRCNFRYITWDDFLDHRSGSKNHWVCKGCELDFHGQAALRQHNVDQHHYCEDCGRLFNTESNLTAVGNPVDPVETMALAYQDCSTPKPTCHGTCPAMDVTSKSSQPTRR